MLDSGRNTKLFTPHPMQHPIHARRPLLLLSLVAGLTGCDGGTTDGRIEAARKLKAGGDAAGAYTAVKAALQEAPSSGLARQLMGQLLLEQSDPVSAELEFRKALEVGYQPAATAALIARSMVAQGKFKSVVDEFGKTPATAQTFSDALTVQVATAHAYLRDVATARRLVDDVLARTPELPEAQLIDAKLVATTGNTDAAIDKVRRLTLSPAPTADAWLFLGDLLLDGRRETKDALDAYAKAVALAPKTLRAHAALITDALRQSDVKRANAQLDQLRRALPQHPLTKLYEAQIAFADGKFGRASEICQEILRRTSGNYSVFLLSGAANLQRGAVTQAIADLGKAMSLKPDAVMPRQLLAQAQLRLGVPAKAVEILRPALEGNTNDPELFSVAAEAYLSMGAFATAETFYQKAAKARPNDPKIATSLALLKLSKGQDIAAIESLELIASSDAGTSANLALISTLMKKKDLAGAMKAVDALAKKTPQSPVADNLRGQILLSKREPANARVAFEAALKKDPKYFSAAANLSRLDVREGKGDAARGRLESLVTQSPGATAPTLMLAEYRILSGEKRSTIQPLLDAAVRANPLDVSLRVAQIDNALDANDPKAAVNYAQQASTALPNSPEIADAQGRAQLSNGEINQSLAAFAKLTKLMPNSALGRTRSARVHLVNKNGDAAAASLRQALEVDPGSVDAQRLLLSLAVSQKNPSLARDAAKAIQKRLPNDAIGFIYAGDIEAELKDFKAAAAAYRAGIGKNRPGKLPSRLHLMLQMTAQHSEAEKFSKTWLSSHPNDTAFAFYVGDAAFARNDYPAAVVAYERVLKIDPDHAMALNNIAYLRTVMKQPGGLALAERANDLSPDMPPIIDTLAFTNAQAGNLKEAIALSKRAMQLAPKDPRYAISLARYLERAGQVADARAVFSKAEKENPSMISNPEAREVKGKLGL